ncbi:MAG: polysaccharide biosynthesis/export family protein [Rikenellaceae bacterium]
MKILLKHNIVFAVILLMVSSCASQKDLLYFQNIPDGYTQEIDHNSYEVKIQPDDLISIMVTCHDPELAQMFNIQATGVDAANSSMLGYLVSKDGYINFPYLGDLKVAGMTRPELTDYLRGELKSRGYINDPTVRVQFMNFQVSVMGEVTSPGTFSIVSDRVTIFDALSLAGDMTIYGKRDNVKIIREENGIRTVSIIDMRDDKILNSPYYYLQQNDVVYVEPNKARMGQSEINQNRTIATYTSILSVLLAVVAIVF